MGLLRQRRSANPWNRAGSRTNPSGETTDDSGWTPTPPPPAAPLPLHSSDSCERFTANMALTKKACRVVDGAILGQEPIICTSLCDTRRLKAVAQCSALTQALQRSPDTVSARFGCRGAHDPSRNVARADPVRAHFRGQNSSRAFQRILHPPLPAATAPWIGALLHHYRVIDRVLSACRLSVTLCTCSSATMATGASSPAAMSCPSLHRLSSRRRPPCADLAAMPAALAYTIRSSAESCSL